MNLKGLTIKDDLGCCGCLFVVIVFWMTLIAAVGGYKAFMWVWNL